MMETERTQRTRLETTVGLYTDFVQRVAEGNLTTRLELAENLETGDQHDDLLRLGNNLNYMVEQLSEMAMQIRQAAEEVSGATQQILDATIEQLTSAAQQETAITETLATVTEVQNAVTRTAESRESGSGLFQRAALRNVECRGDT